jgi:scyllo-inositol 2-dehydrogenase (NADP+)
VRVVLLVDNPAAARVAPLYSWLDQIDSLKVELTTHARWACRVSPADVLVGFVDEQPLSREAEQAMSAHLGRGGGLVLLGSTLHAWRDAPVVTSCVGKPGERQPRTEVIVEVIPHPALRRLDSTIALTDDVWLDTGIPADADPWLRTTWHFRQQELAWSCGHVVVITLGNSTETCADERFARLVLRAIRHAAGLVEPSSLQVGMLGYGAIGAEHAGAIATVDGLDLAAVCDRDHRRLEQAAQAFPGVRLVDDAEDLKADNGIDIMLVSVPPNRHAETATAMLLAGKHVVVEKPFTLTVAEADAVIAAAAESGCILTVYQNRRWDPDFRAVLACVRSGRIGEVFHVETFVGGFAHPCRYWHSHEPVSGGVIYDWGSHYLDWILQIVDTPVAAVSGARHKRVWRDVTNADMARVTIRFAGGQEAEFIHSDIAATPKPKWYVLGTRGAITADWREERTTARDISGELMITPLARTDAQADVRIHLPDSAGRGHIETLTLPPRLDAPFHRNLADHFLTGEPLMITADQARRTTAVLEAASRSAQEGGRLVRWRR